MYDLTQLKTLVTVVQEGHLTRAAERLHISQPTASHHIRALEAHFGLPLFRRTARGLEVTAAGQRIAEWAGQVVQASHELNERARQLAGVPAGRLSIGTIANPRLLASLASAMRMMRDQFPMTDLSLEAGNTRSIRQAIKAGELDGGAIVGTVRGDDLVCHPLGELDYVLVAPAAWRERLEHARPAEIAAQPWVVTGGSTPSQELIERLFREEGLDIRGAVEVSHASLLRAMVAGGMGIGFVQRMEANAGAAAGRFYELSQFQASLPLSFVHRSAQAADEVLSCFTEALGQAWHGLAGADVADPGLRDSVP
jgi:DNA-binding transcriptional LysR family regulator